MFGVCMCLCLCVFVCCGTQKKVKNPCVDSKTPPCDVQNVVVLNSSERTEELTQEVVGCRWDALLISETCRSNKAEIWETQQGHTFMGAGKFENKHGVGIVVNKKWQKRLKGTDCINERAIATSITLGLVSNESVLDRTHSKRGTREETG